MTYQPARGDLQSQSQPRPAPRCCACMKNGRCVRCQCVKKGLPCIDCWPSLSNPSRCANATPTPRGDTVVISAPNPADSPLDLADTSSKSQDIANKADNEAPNAEIESLVTFLSQPKKVLKRVPRKSRLTVARKLTSLIEQVVARNDIPSSTRLMSFPKMCLATPSRGGKRWNLASLVNKQVLQEPGSLTTSVPTVQSLRRSEKCTMNKSIDQLATRVSSKLEESDYKGAVRLACSQDVFAAYNSHTLATLRAKPPHPDSQIAKIDFSSPLPFPITTEDILKAITTFPAGSGGGPIPQHLKGLTGSTAGEGSAPLLSLLVGLITLILEGRTPPTIRPLFFGANLIALSKKDGGIRPIAVGCTLRRLASKCACHHALESIPHLLSPHQLGFGVPKGVEAAVHAARIYVHGPATIT